MISNPFRLLYLALRSLVDFIQIQYSSNNPHDAHLRDVDISDGDTLQTSHIHDSARDSLTHGVAAQTNVDSKPYFMHNSNSQLIVNPCSEVNTPPRDSLDESLSEVSATVIDKGVSYAPNSLLNSIEGRPHGGVFSINDYKSPKSFKNDEAVREAYRSNQHRAFTDEFKICDNLETPLDVLHEVSSSGDLDNLPQDTFEIGMNLVQLFGIACPVIVPLVFFALAYFDIKL